MRSRFLSSAAALPVLFAGPAMAAPQAYNWTGFYLGLNAGGVWTTAHQTTTVPCTEPFFVGYFCDAGAGQGPNAAAVGAAGSGSFSGNGFTGGGEAGFNWQNGAAVYGVEVDLESLQPASTANTSAFPVGGNPSPAGTPFIVTSRVSADTLFTARGRLGWTFDNVLVYGTGGLAAARLNTSYSYTDGTGGTGAWSGGENKVGWTAGAGIEYALSKGWSVKAEYLYVKFGSVTAPGTVFGPFGYSNALSTSTDLTAQIARAGVNYKF
jgi:outer membrane immunogenic protein